jgi:glycosyltransferase involved in cell wall biosynthesis
MSSERSLAGEGPGERAGSARWRAATRLAQERSLPGPGRVLVTASAPFGKGGLGRHLQEIDDALERRARPHAYLGEAKEGGLDERGGGGAKLAAIARTLTPLGRRSPAWRMWMASISFDADAARRMPGAEHLIAFNGTALLQFRAARKAGAQTVSLVCATAHMSHVARRQAMAHSQYGLERPWATRVVRRNAAEYTLADRIYVSTRYIWESFAERGFDEQRLAWFPLTPDPRYTGAAAVRAPGSSFEVVYVGGLTVDKGVPLLLDAVRRLPHRDLRLNLVGGWKTPAMRRHIEGIMARDPRIAVRQGDPLESLRSARLYVHAAYSDGFAYAPAEALACGVPVVVSEDTGMKELITPGLDGVVVPTGDLDALTEAIDGAYRRELLSV